MTDVEFDDLRQDRNPPRRFVIETVAGMDFQSPLRAIGGGGGDAGCTCSSGVFTVDTCGGSNTGAPMSTRT